MRRVFLLTLGCPKNTVASKRLEKGLARAGVRVTTDPDDADALIVNTCGFIEAAIEESIDCLLQLGTNKAARNRKLIAIGCLAERYGAELTAAMPELDACLGLGELDQLPALLGAAGTLELNGQAPDNRPSAYLEITLGCDHGCTFCAIPSIQGPFRSRPPSALLGEARELTAGGSRELVLIGQETGSYGSDLEPRSNLPALLRSLALDSGADLIRVMYLQWYHMTDELLDLVASTPNICEYLDIPLQHANADIIRAMNRRGDGAEYLRRIKRWRERLPEIALRTSVIVGFPGETDENLLELADFLKAADFDYVGVFEFSPEEGTVAAGLPDQVAPEERRERADRLRLLADAVSFERRRSRRGGTVDVLIESREPGIFRGRTRFQAPEVDGEVIFTGEGYDIGDIVPVTIADTDDYVLRGKAIDG